MIYAYLLHSLRPILNTWHPGIIQDNWHQLDLVIPRSSSLNNILITRSYHCKTHRLLVGTKVSLQPNRIHHPSRKEVHVFTQSEPKLSDLCKRFVNTVDKKLHSCPTNSTEERWDHIRDAIYNSAIDAF